MSESISGQWNGGGWVPRTFVMQKVWGKKKQKRRVSQKQIDECLVKEQVANIFQLYLLTGQVRLLNSEKCLVDFGIKVLMSLAETNFV